MATVSCTPSRRKFRTPLLRRSWKIRPTYFKASWVQSRRQFAQCHVVFPLSCSTASTDSSQFGQTSSPTLAATQTVRQSLRKFRTLLAVRPGEYEVVFLLPADG